MRDPEIFEQDPALRARGIEHGFGRRGSDARAPAELTQVVQVHGARLLRAPAATDAEADALWTERPGHAVAVRTADCVPLLLAPGEGGWVAAVHAGWRGLAAGIVESSVSVLCRESGSDPGQLRVAIGPHIGPCCYEVDTPVRKAIDDAGAFAPARPGHHMLDLERCARGQLGRAGVLQDAIARVGGCTFCDSRYASYRRDGSGERMLHWIRMPA